MRYAHQRVGLTGTRARSLARAARSGHRARVRGIVGMLAIALAIADSGASASGSIRAVLEPPTGPLEATTFRATGFDPAAPRPLVLWRFDGERYLRLAETRSGSDGRFDFGLQPLPLAQTDYGVTGLDESPKSSDLQAIDRRLPAPVVAAHDAEDDVLRLLTARAEGEIYVSDAGTGRLLARFAVDPTPGRTLAIDLSTALPRIRPDAIAIEHVLPDGRRSAPEIWLLEGANPQAPE